MLSTITGFCEDESGATAVEYGLIVALLVIAMMTALNGLAGATIDMWAYVADSSTNALEGANP